MGEILVRSATLMEGYYREPELTAAALAGGLAAHGDLGFSSDGDLFITGRKKELIIKGGHNLIPSVIEERCRRSRASAPAAWSPWECSAPSASTELATGRGDEARGPRHRSGWRERIREQLRAHGITIDHVLLVAPGTRRRRRAARSAQGHLRRHRRRQLTGTLA